MGGNILKNHKRYIFFVTVILLVAIVILYCYPRKFNKVYSGVIYRLGDMTYSENIKISFDGYFSKQLLKGDKFEGKISIGAKKLNNASMQFINSSDSPYKENYATIDDYDENSGSYISFGNIVSKNIKNGFTICVYENDKDNKGSKTWSVTDGLMISAPANSRSEALEISKNILRNDKLK